MLIVALHLNTCIYDSFQLANCWYVRTYVSVLCIVVIIRDRIAELEGTGWSATEGIFHHIEALCTYVASEDKTACVFENFKSRIYRTTVNSSTNQDDQAKYHAESYYAKKPYIFDMQYHLILLFIWDICLMSLTNPLH